MIFLLVVRCDHSDRLDRDFEVPHELEQDSDRDVGFFWILHTFGEIVILLRTVVVDPYNRTSRVEKTLAELRSLYVL